MFLRMPGKYTSSCQVQGKIFNQGTYHISASADIPLVESLFFAEDVLTVSIERVQGDYLSRPDALPGVICPEVDWKVLKLEN